VAGDMYFFFAAP